MTTGATERRVHIYALTDPRDGSVRYVGATVSDPERRRTQHCTPSQTKPDTPKARWVRELMALGLRPEIMVLEIVEPKDAGYAERRWLDHYGLYDTTHRHAPPSLTYAATVEWWWAKQQQRLAELREERERERQP